MPTPDQRNPAPTDERMKNLRARANEVLAFDFDLVQTVPTAEFPKRALEGEWGDSELLFASLFQKRFWQAVKATAHSDWIPSVESTPLALIAQVGEGDRSGFLNYLWWSIESHLGVTHPHLISGFPDQGIDGFVALKDRIRCLSLSDLGTYRLLLAIEWIVSRLDSAIYSSKLAAGAKKWVARLAGPSQKIKSDRLDQTSKLIERFREVWELPGSSDLQPHDQSPTRTQLDVRGLPDDFLWYPPSIRRVALAILAVPPEALDTERAKRLRDHTLHRLADEFKQQTHGQYEPKHSKAIDPVVLPFVWCLEKILSPGIDKARKRRRTIRAVLDAVYPHDYLSERSPLGFRQPSARWTEKTVNEYARRGNRAGAAN